MMKIFYWYIFFFFLLLFSLTKAQMFSTPLDLLYACTRQNCLLFDEVLLYKREIWFYYTLDTFSKILIIFACNNNLFLHKKIWCCGQEYLIQNRKYVVLKLKWNEIPPRHVNITKCWYVFTSFSHAFHT